MLPRALLLTATLLAAPAAARAPDQVLPRFQQKTFPAPAAGACGLKSFSVSDYEVRSADGLDDRSRISVMGAALDFTSPSCVRDYVVVQFIRGCVYRARYELPSMRELARDFDVARRLRGPRVVFHHPDFEVDSVDADAAYASDDGADRHAYVYVAAAPLRLRPDRASLLADFKAYNEPAHRGFLSEHPEPRSTVFVTDVPEGGVAFADEARTTLVAVNASLDFRACVYRALDVPTTGDPAPEGAARGGPLHCFSWMSRYHYDPAARDYVTDRFGGVDPYCASAPTRAPLPE